MAASFTQLIGSSIERRFPNVFANAGDATGLTIGALREAERGGTAVVIMCVDLTEQVLSEAISLHANAIIAYAPMPREPLRALRVDDPVGRVVLQCAQQNIATFSLHTACANAPGGAADWIASSLARGTTRPIVAHTGCAEAGEGRLLECDEARSLSALISRLKELLGVRHLRVALGAVVDEHHLAKASDSCFVKSIALQVRPPRPRANSEALSRPPAPHTQVGEGACLLQQVLQGAGPAFSGVFLTSEMAHVDVLAANAKGIIVLLAGQSMMERAFLRHLRQDMQEEFTDADWNVKMKCSETDCHTLTVV